MWGGIFSEPERFHAVVGLAELFNIHSACNAEVLLAGKTEHIARGDEIIVSQSPYVTRLIRIKGRSVYEIIRDKLNFDYTDY